MGELPLRMRPASEESKSGTYSRMKASLKSWSSSGQQSVHLKKPNPRIEVQKPRVAHGHRSRHPTAEARPGIMASARALGKKAYTRGTVDPTQVAVNRFGWPLSNSRNSGKKSYRTDSVPERPEASNNNQDRRPPPRARASFEVDLSPIIEDIHSFPSMGNASPNLDGSSVLDAERLDETRNGDHVEQEYQDRDSRNFDHMNLSGSFILQSTSYQSKRGQGSAENDSVPALVLTFPTPEPPMIPVFAQQSPFKVPKFITTTSSGRPSPAGSGQQFSVLSVPALPRCTHCGFGFGLNFHDLEAPLTRNPCRFCEPQWLACKMWYQARSNTLREPCAIRPAESNASSRAIVGELGLLVGSHGGLGIDVVHGPDKFTGADAQVAEKGYSRFSNVIIQDRTSRKSSAGAVWKKVTRLWAQERTADKSERVNADNLAAEPERPMRLDRRWVGPHT
ncbi:hypothetical protein B0H15DRAFT_811019 [Mycena belliarum]|uniref:Uncharacterized protein n=1 Tax=Mycena belliarum TaxID=1033014 RepID=A0AAD6UNV0_9AGAR|nr:hypothetical protein B0H15DRAFT_811019 [Mycena belliae]